MPVYFLKTLHPHMHRLMPLIELFSGDNTASNIPQATTTNHKLLSMHKHFILGLLYA